MVRSPTPQSFTNDASNYTPDPSAALIQRRPKHAPYDPRRSNYYRQGVPIRLHTRNAYTTSPSAKTRMTPFPTSSVHGHYDGDGGARTKP
ncbi:jg17805 [Pararge aegeria aegeria]|uniref:Jg17805 protein n=1 Tax=Pararge aegeria aegeria TaxID=348720 RepID=A0A8S4SML8_9NEOP|nr:jg17805 [Pararge aegeria aegeria]